MTAATLTTTTATTMIEVEEATARTRSMSSTRSGSDEKECAPSSPTTTPTPTTEKTAPIRRKRLFLYNNKRRSQSTGRLGGQRASSPVVEAPPPQQRPPVGRLFAFRTGGGGGDASPRAAARTNSTVDAQPPPPSPPRTTRSNMLIRRWRSADPNTRRRRGSPPSRTPTPRSEGRTTDAMKLTRVFTVRATTKQQPPTAEERPTSPALNVTSTMETPNVSNVTKVGAPTEVEALTDTSCATAILQHSYLELCGTPQNEASYCYDNVEQCLGRGHSDLREKSILDEEDDHVENNSTRRSSNRQVVLPDDPTVQESIECVFASKLGENLALMLQQDDDDEEEDEKKEEDEDGQQQQQLVAPSVLQQSMLRNRTDRGAANRLSLSSKQQQQQRKSRRLHESLKLVHVGTFDPNQETAATTTTATAADDQNTAVRAAHHAIRCACCDRKTPIVDPSRWPQRPLLLRPTPGSGTVVKGIRKSGTTDYLWKAAPDGSVSTLSWPQALRKEWGQSSSKSEMTNAVEVMCPSCMILPINNGNEAPGESLVIDFESDLFEGTLLLRMRYTEGTTPQPYNDERGYFYGMNRRYQAVIQGRFKEAIPMTQCLTGFVLDRPCGKLPPKWILRGGLKVLSFFAPQLQAQFDGPHPSSLTPLGSTPQVLSVHASTHEAPPVEAIQSEPVKHEHTLLGRASDATATLQRARQRKKAFDRLFTQASYQPVTDPSKVYTFEFLQHLFNFNEFSVELGSMLGSIKLQEILDGQPLQIMALQQQPITSDDEEVPASLPQAPRLWSFDVFHETLLEEAQRHDGLETTTASAPNVTKRRNKR